MKKKQLASALFIIALMLMSTGCAKAPAPADDTCSIETSVWYRERIMLLPGATLTVRLDDVSRMDVAATVLAQETVAIESGPPYIVRLNYRCQDIKDKARYTIRARIEKNDTLMFINTSAVDPFAGDPDKPVDVMVQRVGQ